MRRLAMEIIVEGLLIEALILAIKFAVTEIMSWYQERAVQGNLGAA
ncbi:MAG TPA: hypothetical protein VMU77_00695 [Acidimicrobiales bacterium]|nr:hypothetical protein [Acidimicrobiales bacterium]